MIDLFTDYDLSGRMLNNRAVLAPMTRARAPRNTPDENTARYYSQRGGAGLIVTEGTPVSQQGNGFVDCPGIWNQAQIDGWRRVTTAVHDQGSVIFTQIWHVGRISHVSLQPDGGAPVSSTAKPASGCSAFGYDDGKAAFVPVSTPRALDTDEIAGVVEQFAQGAENAVAAGFDGVEIHGANGYLVEQFINGAVNDRTDRYGNGSVADLTRFVLEVVDACIRRIGKERVGIRLSPFGRLHDLGDFDTEEATFLHLATELGQRGIAYVHIMDQASRGAPAMPPGFLEQFRKAFSGTLILAGGLDLPKANALIGSGAIDLAAFGSPYVANPDLVERFRHGWPLAATREDLYYGGDEHGYTDYPFYGTTAT